MKQAVLFTDEDQVPGVINIVGWAIDQDATNLNTSNIYTVPAGKCLIISDITVVTNTVGGIQSVNAVVDLGIAGGSQFGTIILANMFNTGNNKSAREFIGTAATSYVQAEQTVTATITTAADGAGIALGYNYYATGFLVDAF